MAQKSKIEKSILRPQIELMIKEDKMKDEDIASWANEHGLEITTMCISNHRKKLFKSVIERVEEKSRELVDNLATDRLNLADTIEDSIKKLNELLFDEGFIEDLKPKNAKELAQLLQAKANLIRAEIDARGAAPQQALNIIKLIEKSEQKRRESSQPIVPIVEENSTSGKET